MLLYAAFALSHNSSALISAGFTASDEVVFSVVASIVVASLSGFADVAFSAIAQSEERSRIVVIIYRFMTSIV